MQTYFKQLTSQIMSSSAEQSSPSTYEYEVPDIETFKFAANGVEFKSPFFELHGFRWCLRIFPNGSIKSKVGNVNYFLWLRSLPPKYSKLAVNITLTLKETNTSSSFPHSFSDKGMMTRGWVTG